MVSIKLIAFDQSTTATGWCVMDYHTSEIIDYGTLEPKGETNSRIRDTVKAAIGLCDIHQPTFVFMEGVQYQKNAVVFQVLAKLAGILEIVLEEKGYIVNVVKAPEWRKRVGIKSRRRKELKAEAIAMVEELYGIKPNEDECEAILFARAFCDNPKEEN